MQCTPGVVRQLPTLVHRVLPLMLIHNRLLLLFTIFSCNQFAVFTAATVGITLEAVPCHHQGLRRSWDLISNSNTALLKFQRDYSMLLCRGHILLQKFRFCGVICCCCELWLLCVRRSCKIPKELLSASVLQYLSNGQVPRLRSSRRAAAACYNAVSVRQCHDDKSARTVTEQSL